MLIAKVDKIIELRKAHGLNQKRLSEKAGLPVNAVFRIETGAYTRTQDLRAKAIANALECNIFPKISMMLGALVIVCLLCGSALAAVRWTFYKWERLIRMHDGIMILFEYRDHRDEFLAWREEQKK